MIHCGQLWLVAVPSDQLPVELPRDLAFSGKGGLTLTNLESLGERALSLLRPAARRETTRWTPYLLVVGLLALTAIPQHPAAVRTPCPADRWLPVDQYVGGIEHAILHLLYSAFFHQGAARQVACSASENPFQRLLTQGMVARHQPTRTPQTPANTWPRPRVGGSGPIPAIRLMASGARHLLPRKFQVEVQRRRSSRGDRPLTGLTPPGLSSCSRRTGKRSGVGMTPMWRAVSASLAATVAAVEIAVTRELRLPSTPRRPPATASTPAVEGTAPGPYQRRHRAIERRSLAPATTSSTPPSRS